MFDDLLSANRQYQAHFHAPGIAGKAARRLAVLTCIDSRIDPLAMLGLRPGDAKILRNAGARVTPDALRSLVLAATFLDVERICVVQHTDCAMAGRTNDAIVESVEDRVGVRTDWEFLTMTDQEKALRDDLDRIRACDLISDAVTVGGFMFDVTTGALDPIE